MAPCRNYQARKCTFTSEMCWWKHTDNQDSINCYICNDSFESKTKMMLHRKIKHASHVRICQSFSKNNCRFPDNLCWFSHTEEPMETDVNLEDEDEEISEEGEESNSVFQKIYRNPKPPRGGQTSKQKMD